MPRQDGEAHGSRTANESKARLSVSATTSHDHIGYAELNVAQRLYWASAGPLSFGHVRMRLSARTGPSASRYGKSPVREPIGDMNLEWACGDPERRASTVSPKLSNPFLHSSSPPLGPSTWHAFELVSASSGVFSGYTVPTGL